ncbi:MAG: DUF3105 domain-containing protein [Candidatus Promineifilaceae bacterium]|nr:DUF3105 domain-containing protein [Candidatus Promineifilaceae bacterium]
MGSRRKKPTRSQKQGAQSRNRWTLIVIAAVIVIVIAGLGYLLFDSLRGPVAPEPIAGVHEHPPQERDHVEHEIEAGPLPPVGGSHSPEWQNCGIYDEPVSVENAVHSLEHGAMWLAYQPDLPQEDVEKLRDKVRGEDFVLMSPYPGLQSPVVLTAWELQLELDSVDDDRIDDFVDRYQQGPTTPERGATCRDGVGTPIE